MNVISLPSATKLRRLCFYRCLSVHRGVVSQHALQVVSQHALQKVSRRGCYPSMHCRWYPSMPCNRSPGGCLVWGVCSRRGGIPACTEADPLPPGRDGYCCGRYASHWNAFLFEDDFAFAFAIAFYQCEYSLRPFIH